MKNLSCEIGLIAIILLSAQCLYAAEAGQAMMMASPIYKENKSSGNDKSNTLEIPADSKYQGDSKSESKSGNNSSYVTMVDGLGDCDLSTKCLVLKSSGATSGQIATILAGKGYKTDDVIKALQDNKLDASNTSQFLSGVTQNQQTSNSGASGTVTQTVSGSDKSTVTVDPTGNVTSSVTTTAQGNNNAVSVNKSGNSNTENDDVSDKTQSGGTSPDKNSGTAVTMKNIPGALVFDDRPGKADPSTLQSIQDAIVKTQNDFESMGFSKKNVELHIKDWDNATTKLEIETGMGKNGSLNLTMKIKPGTSNEDIPDVNMMMTHEYVHTVINDKAGGKEPDTVEGEGVSKGFVNYFGESMGGETGLLNHNYVLGNDVENSPTVKDGASKEENNAILSFASALWDLRKDLGADKANKLIYDSLSNIGGNYSFQNAVNALQKADGGQHKDLINNIMQSHGFPAGTV